MLWWKTRCASWVNKVIRVHCVSSRAAMQPAAAWQQHPLLCLTLPKNCLPYSTARLQKLLVLKKEDKEVVAWTDVPIGREEETAGILAAQIIPSKTRLFQLPKVVGVHWDTTGIWPRPPRHSKGQCMATSLRFSVSILDPFFPCSAFFFLLSKPCSAKSRKSLPEPLWGTLQPTLRI